MAAIKEKLRWLILGSEGQLGKCISEELAKSGYPSIVYRHTEFDITNQDNLFKTFSEVKPDVVVNCAAWTDVESAENNIDKVFAVNAYAAEYVAFASKSVGAKLFQISTDYVFSGGEEKPIITSAKPQPLSVYGGSKAMGEELVISAYSEGSFVIRTSWLYSKYGNNFPRKLIAKYLSGAKEIQVVDDQVGQPTFAQDVAERIRIMHEVNLKPGIYHATNSGEASWFDFARLLFENWEFKSDILVAIEADKFKTLAQRPKYSVLDDSFWAACGLSKMRSWEKAVNSSARDILRTYELGVK